MEDLYKYGSLIGAILLKAQEFKALDLKATDGYTINLDGSEYRGNGIAVALVSTDMNLETDTWGDIRREALRLLDRFTKLRLLDDRIKFGLFKFENQSIMSLDITMVVPPQQLDLALQYSCWAGQKELWDYGREECIKTGTQFSEYRNLTDADCVDITRSFEAGMLPVCVTDYQVREAA